MALIYTPTGWVDDDGSGQVGTLGDAATMNNIEQGVDQVTDLANVLAYDGIAGENLLPDFDPTWWVSAGSGIVNTYDVGTPYRIRVGGENVSKVLQCSVQAVTSGFLAALNPAANYLWLEPGKTYSWGVWVRPETIARNFRIRSIFFQENGTTQIATPGGEYTALVTGVVGEWLHIVRTVTAPAAAAGQKYVRFRPYIYIDGAQGSVGSPELVYLTEPVLVEGQVIPHFRKSAIDLQNAIDTKQDFAGELQAIADLTLAADRLVYFTGPSAAAQTALSAFMRTLLDDADAATARATLGTDAASATRTPTDASVGWAKTGLGAAGLAQHAFYARRNANSGAFAGVGTAVVGCTTEVSFGGLAGDVGGAYDAPNGEYVTPFAGWFHFDVEVVWLNAPTLTRYRLFLFDDSNAPGPALGNLCELALIRNWTNGTEDLRLVGSVTLPLPAGAHVEPRIAMIDATCAGTVFGAAAFDATHWSGYCVGRL